MSGEEKSSYPLTLAQTPPLLTSHSTGFSVTSPAHHPLKTMVRGQLEPTETSHERGLLKFPFAETPYKRAIPLIHTLEHTHKLSWPVSPIEHKYSRFTCLPVWFLIGGVHKERSATPEGWGFTVHLVCLQHRDDRQAAQASSYSTDSVPADDTHPPPPDGWSGF